MKPFKEPQIHKFWKLSYWVAKEVKSFKNEGQCQVLVAHTCNLSYSEGRDQEDHSSKSAQANSLQDPISKNPITKNWAGRVAQGKGPEFKPLYHKKAGGGQKTFKSAFCLFICLF
jgi:hypothetical protein